MSKRMTPTDRKAAILEAAVRVASDYGFNTVKLRDVAAAAGCSTALVMIYWTSMETLLAAVMREAIKRRKYPIVVNGLVNGDPTAKAAPHKVRAAALASIGT